jgi:hypothetical protein
MSTRKKAAAKQRKRSAKITKLPQPTKELSAEEQKHIQGGSLNISSTNTSQILNLTSDALNLSKDLSGGDAPPKSD